MLPDTITNYFKSIFTKDDVARLIGIYIYPVKSCGAYQVSSEWPLDNTGLKYDRNWMIIKEDGVPLTQYDDPKLCLIKPRISLKSNSLYLSFEMDGADVLQLRLELEEDKENGKIYSNNVVEGREYTAFDCGEEAANWLTRILNMKNIRLVKMISTNTHPDFYQKYTDRKLSFSSRGQILLLNYSSVCWVNDKLEEYSLNFSKENIASRFRGNLIIKGNMNAWEESSWRYLKIGSVRFKVEESCKRCVLINIDQSTSLKHKEILKSLKCPESNLNFGLYLGIDDDDAGGKKLRLNDVVTME